MHCLGRSIKYGNPEVGNTTQQLLPTARPCCSIEFIELFLFWIIIITYNSGIYICIYIYIYIHKVTFIHSFSVIFNCNAFPALYAKHFEIWKKYFVKLMSRLLHSMIHQVMWYFWVFIVNPLSPLWSFFFSRKLCLLLSPCLLLIAESISLDTSGKPTVRFSCKLLLPLE